MSFTFILGCCSVLLVSLQGVRCLICEDSDVSNVIRFPIHPLKISDLLGRVIPPGQDQSPRYYEIYSFDFPNQTLPLPLLRKVSIRWKISQGFQFTNDFAGWLPPPYSLNDDGICESDNILFDKIMDRPYQDTWMFNFSVIFPEDEEYVGVSFSSYPERYLINWYCSRKYLQMGFGGKYKSCSCGLRMSIYSSDGPNHLPWDLIVKDICQNKTPRMDDPRWTMTYDAPELCSLDPQGSRKKRSTGYRRHYL